MTNTDKSNLLKVETIGQKLRMLRGGESLLLRQVAAGMEMDTALLSKIERDERKPSKKQVLAFAKFYRVNADELLVAWLSDKLASEVQDEHVGLIAIQVAEEKLKFQRIKNTLSKK